MAGARSFGPAYIKRTFRFNATRKGLLGGSRFWLTMFGLIQVAKWSGKVTKRGDAPVKFSESLLAGESFVVRHIDAATAKAEATGGADSSRA